MRERSEISHPLLWTLGLVGFGFLLGYLFHSALALGRLQGQGSGTQTVAAAAATGPDHMALIRDLDQADFERGKQLYEQHCVTCHGKDGHLNVGGARKFGIEPFQNDKYGPGANPLSMFNTLTKGWGNGMASYAYLPAEERYALVHYVREAFVKSSEQAEEWYRPLDEEYLAELDQQAPSNAAPVNQGPLVPDPHPATQPLALPIYIALERAAAEQDDAMQRRAQRLLMDLVRLPVPDQLRAVRDGLARLAGTRLGDRLYAAVDAGDRQGFEEALLAPQTLDLLPPLAVLDAEERSYLFTGLQGLLARGES